MRVRPLHRKAGLKTTEIERMAREASADMASCGRIDAHRTPDSRSFNSINETARLCSQMRITRCVLHLGMNAA